MADTVLIDGSTGEGGGQVIRTSLSLAAITGRAVEIVNVRARRTRPGLQPQHLTAVRSAAAMCVATLEGAELGSSRLVFAPAGPPVPGRYHFEIGTAGAAPLVMQTVLVPLALAEGSSHVTVLGGTHLPHAPPADYLAHPYLHALAQAGINAEASYDAAGFYPRGGGRIEATVRGNTTLTRVELTERGRLRSLRARVITCGLPEHVAERGRTTIEQSMKQVGRRVEVECLDLPSAGTGAAVVLAAECEGGYGAFTSIGERGKPMEKVAEEPCREFMEWWKRGAACDEHLADQLVLPLSLAPGESRWTTAAVTEHLRTVLWVAQQFLPIEYTLEEREDGTGDVALNGVSQR
jgi:RNA 3'-terminal phosphate cyclase (ATP)